MKWVVKDHAIRRYIKRHAPSLTFTEARQQVIRSTRTAARQREKTSAGDFVYISRVPPLRLVVKHEAGMVVVVTVLPSRAPSGMTEAELAIVQEWGLSARPQENYTPPRTETLWHPELEEVVLTKDEESSIFLAIRQMQGRLKVRLYQQVRIPEVGTEFLVELPDGRKLLVLYTNRGGVKRAKEWPRGGLDKYEAME